MIRNLFTVIPMIKGLLCLLLVASASAQAAIIYVTPAGTGDGSNWVNAAALQDALTAGGNVTATSGDEIWVAAGTYKPTTGTDRTIAFVLVNGVQIYGGFNGTETNRNERNWLTNVTILSGDIDNNDINTDGNSIAETADHIVGDNSFNVLRSSGTGSTTVVDGFTITGGATEGC